MNGSLLFRKTDKEVDGKEIYMVVGVVAVEPHDYVKDEMLHVLTGNTLDLQLLLPHEPSKDLGGMTANQILTSPIWKV